MLLSFFNQRENSHHLKVHSVRIVPTFPQISNRQRQTWEQYNCVSDKNYFSVHKINWSRFRNCTRNLNTFQKSPNMTPFVKNTLFRVTVKNLLPWKTVIRGDIDKMSAWIDTYPKILKIGDGEKGHKGMLTIYGSTYEWSHVSMSNRMGSRHSNGCTDKQPYVKKTKISDF